MDIAGRGINVVHVVAQGSLTKSLQSILPRSTSSSGPSWNVPTVIFSCLPLKKVTSASSFRYTTIRDLAEAHSFRTLGGSMSKGLTNSYRSLLNPTHPTDCEVFGKFLVMVTILTWLWTCCLTSVFRETCEASQSHDLKIILS